METSASFEARYAPLPYPTNHVVLGRSTCTVTAFDRHRGSGCPLTPATPPCVRVRTRRFEMVTLTRILQIRETERFKIGRGKRDG